MFKNLLCSLFVIGFLTLPSKAQWVSLDDGKSEPTPPNVTLLSSDLNSAVVKINISGFHLTELLTENKSYHSVSLLTEMFTNKPGFPEVPYIAEILAIPDQAGVSVEIIEIGSVQVFKNIYLPPARESWIEGRPEPPYLENPDAFKSDQSYPPDFAEMDKPVIYRDFRISRLAIYPVRYSPATAELHVVNSITVSVNFGEGEVINPKTSRRKPIAPSFAQLYRSSIFNYQQMLDLLYDGREDGHDLMLCIMPDEFQESFQIYANWKRQSGTDIRITLFSDIGANANNPDIIRNHISEVYFLWENPPTYVLIIGDDGVFPKKIVTYPGYSFPWEEFFVAVDGNDYFPEMMIGRFTNQGDYRMQVMINKFMLYEQQPYTDDPDWFKKATLCSNNAYQSQVDTKRFAANVLLEDGNFISVDTMMSDGTGWGYGCTYSINDIMSALNQGRSFLNYRGEGWSQGWYATCYDFYTDNVSSLNNGQKFTFVTSIGCGVAMFNASGGNCFGEEWVQLGSLTSPRGGIGFIGPTSNSHTTYNNRIDKGIYVGMFREDMDTPGQAMARGKLYMFNVFGNEYYVEYHYKVYCVLGDPNIHIWKDLPRDVTVVHPESIPLGHAEVEITVYHASSGLPVDTAQVTLVGEELFITGFTDATGTVKLDVLSDVEETLTVTVRGQTVIPNQSSLEIIQADELIEPVGQPIIEDLNGNNDGLINPNENVHIAFTLKNYGSTIAGNVLATLACSDENIEILTTNPITYGNMAPGATIEGDPFQLFVKPDCPIGHTVQMQLHVESELFSWDYTHTIEISGCNLSFDNFVVFDPLAPNPNYRIDPGETIILIASISNYGDDAAPDVTGILTSNDQYIQVTDQQGTFGTLAINGSATNFENYFVVTVSQNCPVGHLAELALTLNTQNGFYPYEQQESFTISVGIGATYEYTGPDDYGYYAYSSDDTFYEETPQYDWKELVGTGTQISLPPASSYTTTVDLPFTFTYYGNNYTQVRISTDGWIAFGSGTQTAPVNAALPHNDNVNNMVAVLWDDLYDEEFFMGKIYYHHDAANHRFIVEWDSISHADFIEEPVRETFQVQLMDPAHHNTITGDGEVIMQYRIVQQPETVTVGIENDAQNIGITYLFNNNYHHTASALKNEYAIKFTTNPPFESMIVSVEEDDLLNGHSSTASGLINRPNPFSSATDISFNLTQTSVLSLQIFDVNGELITNLFSGRLNEGNHTLQWNGLNDNGKKAGAGIYFCRLQSEGFSETIKLLMFR
jgi:hypothetical protein